MNKNKRISILFAGFLGLFFLMFAWRQFYGFNKNDEIFYISTVYRFFQGDAMLVDEWNNVQLFAFITYPVYCLIRLFHHSNEGIVIIFRIAYLICQAAAATYCYVRMKRFGWVRILPALFYFVTTPYNINSLSYNTLAFGFVLLVLVTMASVEDWKPIHAFLCGIFSAGAVLANPYAVLLFILYGVLCAVSFFRNRKRQEEMNPLLSVKSFIFMGLGAFAIFVLFVIFVFSRAGLSEILESFSYIVMDTERKKPFLEKFAKYFIRIHRYYKGQVYVTAVLLAAWVLDRKKKIPGWLYLVLEMVAALPYIVLYGFFGYSSVVDVVGINYIMIPLSFVGMIAYVTAKQKDRRLFWCWYVPGLIYTLLAHFATDTGILTVSASYMIPSAASILLTWQAVYQQSRESWKRNLRSLFYIFLAVLFLACIYLRMVYVWGDEHMPYLTAKLEEGPLKGIHTSQKNEILYQNVLDDMEDLQLTEEDRLFVVGIAPWMYLNTDAECAAYSTWMTQETDPLIPLYYELHPEKLPTVIYCYGYDESMLDTEFAVSFTEQGYETSMMRQGLVFKYR